MMRFLLILCLLILCLLLPLSAAPAPINPASVAVLYNSDLPESKKLAEAYADYRKIPFANLIGLPLPKEAEITRAQFNQTLLKPLRAHFTTNEWWTLAKDANGILLPRQNRIRFLVTVKGVPLKISRNAIPADSPENQSQFGKINEAAVDSELALLGVHGYPLGGPSMNPYFQQDLPFAANLIPFMMLVGRIDAASYETATGMILDALDTEEKGLWGRAYVDFAKKGGGYAIGDEWMEKIVTKNREVGIPTVIDRLPDTFVDHYPMTEAALYFGWYAGHKNGPLNNRAFRFKKGSIAVHLHSFSATQLTNPNRHWSAPILARGAAATLGNVYEPFLQMSHHFDIFHDRLLKGYSLAEAAYMAVPVLSWQCIVLGDPLYRPYQNFTKPTAADDQDRDYIALRAAYLTWPNDEALRTKNLAAAAEKMNSGTLHEALGLLHLEKDEKDEAAALFQKAEQAFTDPQDQVRQAINLTGMAWDLKNPGPALGLLAEGEKRHGKHPSFTSLRTILDPPPPPPTPKE